MKILPKILVNGILLFSVATPLASANEAFHKDDANLYDSNSFALGAGWMSPTVMMVDSSVCTLVFSYMT